MPDPVYSLTVAIIILIAAILIFWPQGGVFYRLRKASRSGQKILMEDALKHVYECDTNNETCTYKSLAGALSIHPEKIAKLITRLENFGLITLDSGGFKLTKEGRDYALRIIRVHRLWERYLAEETSVPEESWHTLADIKEHSVTEEEANELSKKLGYPRYDPHGDPIPTKSGDVPKQTGTLLTGFEKGDTGMVIHVEDEPRMIYSELINQGITLGAHIKLLKRTSEHMEILLNGNKTKISILLAANVTLGPLLKDSAFKTPLESLSVLRPGESGEVIGISRACRGTQRRRLMDLGIIPGTIIKSELENLNGDPVAYRIRGAVIALRKDQSELIYIKRLKEAA